MAREIPIGRVRLQRPSPLQPAPWEPGQPVVPGVTRRRFLQYTALGSGSLGRLELAT